MATSRNTRRDFLKTAAATAVVPMVMRSSVFGAEGSSPNDTIRVATVGTRGKGATHFTRMEAVDGCNVTALCDIDQTILRQRTAQLEKKTGRKLKKYTDYRELVEDPDVDAISIATCNHTHTLIAIAAMAAGKDVYVEKPCSHNIWEGQQLVNAARKYKRMCQHGTQGRSCDAIREGIAKLHEGVIGDVYMARGLCYKWRNTIGHKADCPVPKGVDYDLWLGPAPKRPFNPNRFHYNWHWHWDYGNGDMGNQGVHEMDLARWGLGVGMPTKIQAAGGHYMFDDDQETPNSLSCTFEYPEAKKMLIFETRHWITPHEGMEASPASNEVGVTFFGSEGYMQMKYFGYKTYLGKKREKGPENKGSSNEYQRFIDAVRSRKDEDLGVNIEEGFKSTSLCHLGNIAYRVGRTVQFDPQTCTFPGDDAANSHLSREYRKPFIVPKIEA